ncbi:MAG: tetratricopeptide repeat protein [Planctomycetota bacterium]
MKFAAFPALIVVLALALFVRAWAPGADPPGYLDSSHRASTEGPRHLARAAARAGLPYGGAEASLPAGLGRPVAASVEAAALRSFGGTDPATRIEVAWARYAALVGAALSLVAFLLLLKIADPWVALIGATAIAIDTMLVGWARAGGPVPLGALFGMTGMLISVWGRGGLIACGLGLLVCACGAWGADLTAGFYGVAIAAIALQELARRRTGHGRVQLWVVLGVFVVGSLAVLTSSPDAVGYALRHMGHTLRTLSPAELVQRAISAPARSRLSLVGPVVTAVLIAAPLLLRKGRNKGRTRRGVERSVVWVVLLAWLGIGLFAGADATRLVASLVPMTLVGFVLATDAITTGGRRRLRAPGLAWFLAALVLFSVIVETVATASGMLPVDLPWPIAHGLVWLGAAGGPGARVIGHRLLFASALAALVAALAAIRSKRRRARPRPGIATALLLVHWVYQVALVATPIVWPAYTILEARADVRASLPQGAKLGGVFGYALALGPGESLQAVENSPWAGPTHVARIDRDPHAESAVSESGCDRVTSLFVGGRRLQLQRQDYSGALSSFERGRQAMEAGDLVVAEQAFESVAKAHPAAQAPHLYLALLHVTNEDDAQAEQAVERALSRAPSSVVGRTLAALVALRADKGEEAVAHLEAAFAAFGSATLERTRDDLRRAIAEGDARARARVLEALPLLAADLLH